MSKMSQIQSNLNVIFNDTCYSEKTKKNTSDSFKSSDSVDTCVSLSSRKTKSVSFFPIVTEITVQSYKKYNKLNSYDNAFFEQSVNAYYGGPSYEYKKEEKCFTCLII